MSTKPFYDRNATFVAEVSDVEQARSDLQTPGTRYHCVADTLADTGSLSALELGLGSIMRARYFASIFGQFEAADISATVLLDGRDAGFAYRDFNLDETWALDDASIDAVMAMMVFEHLFDPFHPFAELACHMKTRRCAQRKRSQVCHQHRPEQQNGQFAPAFR